MSNPKFRTHEEMHEKYGEFEQFPDRGHPYCVTVHGPDRYFGFIGTSHTSDASDPQWKKYMEEWELFLKSTNPNKTVFYEGRSNEGVGESIEEVIRTGSDAGLTIWLAKKENIKHISPEPDRKEEVTALLDRGFSSEDIATYYIGRQIGQWVRHDRNTQPDLDEYIASTLRYMNETWEHGTTSEHARKLVEDKLGRTDLEDMGAYDFAIIADPSQNPVSSASSQFRDESIFSAIEKAWSEGEDIFCVYGSGHAIVMEPALRDLIGESNA